MLANAQHLTPDAQVSSPDILTKVDAAHSRPDSEAESSGELNIGSATAAAAAARTDVVVLDVRNDYEWDAGHFQGADRPHEVGSWLPVLQS